MKLGEKKFGKDKPGKPGSNVQHARSWTRLKHARGVHLETIPAGRLDKGVEKLLGNLKWGGHKAEFVAWDVGQFYSVEQTGSDPADVVAIHFVYPAW